MSDLDPILKLDGELYVYLEEHKTKCSKCGHIFVNGDKGYLGYLEDKTPAFLCKSCTLKNMQEFVLCMYFADKEQAEEPIEVEKLWRYMDLPKFISLIGRKSLYFSSIKGFSDPFECAYCDEKSMERSKKIREKIMELSNYLEASKQEDFNPKTWKYPANELDEMAMELVISASEKMADRIQRTTYINCWHLNENESDAMWKLYSKDVENGIAIQTTYGHLRDALSKKYIVDIRKVIYIDYIENTADDEEPYWYKRKSFQHEREVRAVIKNGEFDLTGINVSVDLNMLIDNIYISPYASKWFYEVVKDVISVYGIEKEIRYSEMKNKPYFYGYIKKIFHK